MSVTYDGHNTWVRFAKQSAKGVSGTSWHLWDGAGDSLVFGEAPDDRGVLYGDRGKRRGAKRQGMQLPGGALPAYPWFQDGSSVELGLILKNFWQGSITSVVDAGTDGTLYMQTLVKGTQLVDTAWSYLTFQKQTGIQKKGEVFLDVMTDSIEFNWESGGHMTITPTVKSLTASRDGTITGTGTPITAGFVQAPNLAFEWNGTTVYPANFKLMLANGIPDRQSGASRGRQSMHLGDFTGQLTIGAWRDSDSDAHFRAPYSAADPTGTLIAIWTIGTAYGSHNTGAAFSGTITAYIAPDWLDMPTQEGDLIDSFTGDVLADTTMSYTTELSAI